ncbi:hypothetical protein PIB30_013300 [Stylosanthes scabra]|uniref:Uncharacterized protein n=1 Tax=Stylosanthes scabra TaxID=79078 RepID=A0ABU6T624_9FABA|nr:hypothetical protein [Stylosanthes scabra]
MGKGRAPCCDKSQVKKGPWSPAEDLKLIAFIQKHGHENWRSLPKQAGLMRCGKSCRLRWINYLRPDVKRGNFTAEEEETIIKLHKAMGNKWSKIASRLPGRTDNEIKNVWNTHLKKRLTAKYSSDSVAEDNNNNNNNADESKIESSSLTSPSSSSSESFFSNEETPKTNNNNLCNETNDHNVSQTDDDHQQLKRSSNYSSSSSLSSCVENKHHHDDEDHNQQQLVSPPLLNYVGPYDVDVTLEEVDKPNNLETKEEDCEFWKMLDNIETFLSSNEVSPPPHQTQTSPPNLVHQDDDEAMMMMWSHELENELNGVVGDETTTKGSNNKAQQEIIMDPNDVLHNQLELDLDLGFIQLWPSLPQNTP